MTRTILQLFIETKMKRNGMLGGRNTLELTDDDKEQLMYMATNEYHNSKCPDCGKNVSCVCISSGCPHIWYCPDHILNHEHREGLQ